MSITASESRSPLGESQANERRKRLDQLSSMVFELVAERHLGVTNNKFDGVESADLIDALRACSSYADPIVRFDYGDSFVVQVRAIDGYDYIIQISLFGPGFSVKASRVRHRTLLLVGPKGQVESTQNTLNVQEENSRQLKLGRETTDRAFLVGMSLVIGLMDDQDEDQDEDARLAPLLAQVMPTDDELREIRAKLPPPTINYDEEGDQPY